MVAPPAFISLLHGQVCRVRRAARNQVFLVRPRSLAHASITKTVVGLAPRSPVPSNLTDAAARDPLGGEHATGVWRFGDSGACADGPATEVCPCPEEAHRPVVVTSYRVRPDLGSGSACAWARGSACSLCSCGEVLCRRSSNAWPMGPGPRAADRSIRTRPSSSESVTYPSFVYPSFPGPACASRWRSTTP